MRPCVFYLFSFVILQCLFEISADLKMSCMNNEYTYFMASIQSGYHPKCVGVILNQNTVMTTALCVTDHLYRRPNGECNCGQPTVVVYGLVPANLFGMHCAQHIDVEKTYVHKKFKRSNNSLQFDVAILRTKGNMNLGKGFKPPVLPSTKNPKVMLDICEKNAVVAGWWLKYNQKDESGEIICLSVTIGKLEDCARGAYLTKESLMCTQDKALAVCNAYYGAPLFCKEKTGGKVLLYGLLSHRFDFDRDCKKEGPLFYTRTDEVRDFLRYPEDWS